MDKNQGSRLTFLIENLNQLIRDQPSWQVLRCYSTDHRIRLLSICGCFRGLRRSPALADLRHKLTNTPGIGILLCLFHDQSCHRNTTRRAQETGSLIIFIQSNKTSRTHNVFCVLGKSIFFGVLRELRFQCPHLVLKSYHIGSRYLLPLCCIEILALGTGSLAWQTSRKIRITSCFPLFPVSTDPNYWRIECRGTHLATPAACSQSVRDPRRMVVALMTALSTKGLGLPSLVDRALSLPEQVRGVHRHNL